MAGTWNSPRCAPGHWVCTIPAIAMPCPGPHDVVDTRTSSLFGKPTGNGPSAGDGSAASRSNEMSTTATRTARPVVVTGGGGGYGRAGGGASIAWGAAELCSARAIAGGSGPFEGPDSIIDPSTSNAPVWAWPSTPG